MKDRGTIETQTVDILVATYNGEKYIRAQLLSLLFQTHADIRVIVHDDGSTDKTCDIVREIARKDSRVTLIEDSVRCGGAGKNFMHLLKFSTAEAVMFCDQDDIWFDNKVAAMIAVLKKKDNRIPQVVYSEAYAWYDDRGIDGLAMNNHPNNLKSFLFLNGAFQGCAAMFNRSMRNLLSRWHGDLWMHDHSLLLIALALSEEGREEQVTYLSSPLMLYRRHQDSVTGKLPLKSTCKTLLITNRTRPVVVEGAYNAVNQFIKIYGEEINRSNRLIIESYLRMRNMSLVGRAFYALRNGFEINNSNMKLILKLFLRPYIKKFDFNS